MNLSANLFTKEDRDPEGIRVSPFNVDCFGPDEDSSPGRFLRDALNGRFTAKFGGTERINGIEALVVVVDEGLKYGFDPKRGYLIVYASDKAPSSGRRYYEVDVLEARECSARRWFPTRVVRISQPDTAGPYKVSELKVTKLDVDSRPAADEFRLQLAKDAQVSVIGRMEWVNLKQTKTVTTKDLPALLENMKRVGDEYLAREGSQPRLSEGGSTRTLYLTAVAVALAALTAALFVKWRRRKSHPEHPSTPMGK